MTYPERALTWARRKTDCFSGDRRKGKTPDKFPATPTAKEEHTPRPPPTPVA